MENMLKSFLSAYVSWVDAGAPASTGPSLYDGEPVEDNPFCFSTTVGLCQNSAKYLNARGEGDSNDHYWLREELKAQFRLDGLDEDYPFHDGWSHGYDEEAEACAMHLNRARLQWARNYVES